MFLWRVSSGGTLDKKWRLLRGARRAADARRRSRQRDAAARRPQFVVALQHRRARLHLLRLCCVRDVRGEQSRLPTIVSTRVFQLLKMHSDAVAMRLVPVDTTLHEPRGAVRRLLAAIAPHRLVSAHFDVADVAAARRRRPKCVARVRRREPRLDRRHNTFVLRGRDDDDERAVACRRASYRRQTSSMRADQVAFCVRRGADRQRDARGSKQTAAVGVDWRLPKVLQLLADSILVDRASVDVYKCGLLAADWYANDD